MPQLFHFTWRQRKAFSKIENDSSKETNDSKDYSTEVLRGLSFVYENYKPHSWYWELVETVRKVILTSGLILVGGEKMIWKLIWTSLMQKMKYPLNSAVTQENCLRDKVL